MQHTSIVLVMLPPPSILLRRGDKIRRYDSFGIAPRNFMVCCLMEQSAYASQMGLERWWTYENDVGRLEEAQIVVAGDPRA